VIAIEKYRVLFEASNFLATGFSRKLFTIGMNGWYSRNFQAEETKENVET
jgi:hypothetical protein